jgi:uncharacterized membrane protein
MDELNGTRSARPSLADSFFRLIGLVILVVIGVWLAFRVIAGVVHFFIWLLTTALIVGVVLAAVFLVFRGRGGPD